MTRGRMVAGVLKSLLVCKGVPCAPGSMRPAELILTTRKGKTIAGFNSEKERMIGGSPLNRVGRGNPSQSSPFNSVQQELPPP